MYIVDTWYYIYSRTSLIRTSIIQTSRLTEHQICAAMLINTPISSDHEALSDHYLFVSYVSRATKQKDVDFSDLSALTSIQRLERRTLAVVV